MALTGKLVSILKGASRDARFSPDGQHVVTVAADDTARVWELKTGRMLVALRGDEKELKRSWFSRSGKRIVTQFWGTVRVWEVLGDSVLTPTWFVDFLRLMAQRKFDDDGKLVTPGEDEIAALALRVKETIARENSRPAAIARWLLTPAHMRPQRPFNE
jgi:WD40 repeat protein